MDIFRYIGYGASIVGVFVLILIAAESLRDLVDGIKYNHHQKHRFDKPPLAKCYCIDCESYNPTNNSCSCHTGWSVYDAWFCWSATPRKRNKFDKEKV